MPPAPPSSTTHRSTGMASYHFQTEIGTFWIRPHFGSTGMVQLGVDRTPIGSFRSPQAAADDFRERRTGWYEWDCRSELPAPRDLAEWAKGMPRHLASTPYLSHRAIR